MIEIATGGEPANGKPPRRTRIRLPGFRLTRVNSRLVFRPKNQASCDVSQDARQPSPRTALPPRVSIDAYCPFVHVTLVTWPAGAENLFCRQWLRRSRTQNGVVTSNLQGLRSKLLRPRDSSRDPALAIAHLRGTALPKDRYIVPRCIYQPQFTPELLKMRDQIL